jgi:quinol monooxygenase YgiN
MAFALTAKWTVGDGEMDLVEGALRKIAGPTRAEPGCLLWQPHRDPENPAVLFVYEQYTDRAAYESHLASEHFDRWVKNDVLPRLQSRERAFYETLDF